MILRCFLPLIMSAFCAIGAPGQQDARFDIAAEQYLQAELDTPLDDELFFNKLMLSWQDDIRISRDPAGQNHDIEELSDAELEAVYRTVEYYIEAARAAYAAQMDFARHSLSSVQQESPELYSTTLTRYRSALQQLYMLDLQILRAASPLVANPPAVDIVETDDFIGAINHRASISAWGGAASSAFCGAAGSFAQQQLEFKRKYMADIICHQSEEIYLAPELLSNHRVDKELTAAYYSTAKDKFATAEEAWESYSLQAANLLCPGGLGEGQGSGICKMFLRIELMKNHEKYYALLLMGFSR